MKVVALLLAFLGSAVAFAPAARRAARLTTTMAAEKSAALPFMPKPSALDGSMPGDVGFDPLGFSSIDPVKLPQIIPPAASMATSEPLPTLYWMREAELKHGRICMLAVTGFAAVDMGFRFPGAKYADLTSVTAHDAMVASGNMGFLFLAVALIELISSVALVQAAQGSGRVPGDFALDPMKFTQKNEKETERLRLAEVTHARLAMLAFSGMVTQAVAVGDKFPYQG